MDEGARAPWGMLIIPAVGRVYGGGVGVWAERWLMLLATGGVSEGCKSSDCRVALESFREWRASSILVKNSLSSFK